MIFLRTNPGDLMKTVCFGEKFNLNIQEGAAVEGENVTVIVKSVARLQVPRGGDQFILQLTLTQGGATEAINLDGPFQFPTNNVRLERGRYRISVTDIDFMGRFATLIIERLVSPPPKRGKGKEGSGKTKN